MIAQVIRRQLPAVPPDPDQVTKTKGEGATAVPALSQQAAAGSPQQQFQGGAGIRAFSAAVNVN